MKMQDNQDAYVLKDIRNAEKESDSILEKAEKEKEKILNEAQKKAEEIFQKEKESAKDFHEKKLVDFRSKSDSMLKEKIEEGRKQAAQLESKAKKNMDKAFDFIMKKFEEML